MKNKTMLLIIAIIILTCFMQASVFANMEQPENTNDTILATDNSSSIVEMEELVGNGEPKYTLDISDPIFTHILIATEDFRRVEAGGSVSLPAGAWVDVYTTDEYLELSKRIFYTDKYCSNVVLWEQFDPDNPQKGYHFFLEMPNYDIKLESFEKYDEEKSDIDDGKYRLDLSDKAFSHILIATEDFRRVEAGDIVTLEAGAWVDIYTTDEYSGNFKKIYYKDKTGNDIVLWEEFDPDNPHKGYHYFLEMPNYDIKLKGFENDGYELDLSDPFISYAVNVSDGGEKIEGGEIVKLKEGSIIDIYTNKTFDESGCILSYISSEGYTKKLWEQFDSDNPEKGKHYLLIMPDYDVRVSKYDLELKSDESGEESTEKAYMINYSSEYLPDDLFLPEKYIKGDTFIIPDVTRPGYKFGGWFNEKTGKRVKKITSRMTGNINLYAKWTPYKYIINFSKNGSKVSGKNIKLTKVYGDVVDINEKAYTRKGYKLVGWATSKNGYVRFGNVFTVDESLFVDNKRTLNLYAVWERELEGLTTHKITYTSNDELAGVGLDIKLPEYYVEGETTSLPTMKNEGYKFLGWYNSATGRKIKSITNKENTDITLCAKWERKKMTIAFNKNAKDAKSKMEKISTHYGDSITLPENSFTLDGYVFAGWAIKKKGDVIYTDKSVINGVIGEKFKTNNTLYACWKKKSKDITLSDEKITLNAGESYSLCLHDELNNIINTSASWVSNDTSVVIVDELGNISACEGAAGSTVITAECYGIKKECLVTVVGNDDGTIKFEGFGYSLKVGEIIDTIIIGNEGVDISKCTYTSSDTSIATINSEGKIEGISEGQCTIEATYGTHKTECEVNVFREVETTSQLQYCSHIQDIGWLSYVNDGEITGTTGRSKRLEALKIELLDDNLRNAVEYSVYVDGRGWTDYKTSGELAGTTGESRSIKAIRIKTCGSYENMYDICYRVHVSELGWLGWTKNGMPAGGEDAGLRVEAIQIKIVKRGTDTDLDFAKISHITRNELKAVGHIANYGWMNSVSEGAVIGTTGQSLRLEATKLYLTDWNDNSAISYRAHVSDKGWLSWVNSGEVSGTTGEARALEAIQIKLTGDMAKLYDIYYRTHVADYGWLGWAKNGETAGTTGGRIRAEALQIKVVAKNASFDKGGSAFINISQSAEILLQHHMGSLSLNQHSYHIFDTIENGNEGCCCTAAAIGASIVTGIPQDPTTLRDGNNLLVWNAFSKMVGKTMSKEYGFETGRCYSGLKAGRPTLVGWGNNDHWVVIIGIRAGANTSNLSYGDFIAIDPSDGQTKNLENCLRFSKYGYVNGSFYY